ncbi:MAG TPA: hypothetical protein VER11_34665 [Polyangiaceae bacterium]|nr:hypothetical protein [Polyangiaceae bacterium]
MKIAIQDCDYEKALDHHFTDGKKAWGLIRAAAEIEAARRLLQENSDKRKRLESEADSIDTKTNAGREAWLAKHDEITRSFRESERLSVLAFPASSEAAPR